MSIGERITCLRKEKNLSQGQLAALLGVSRQAISKWENDQASPDTLNLIKLAETLNSDVTFLATGQMTEAPAPEPIVMTVVKEVEVEKPIEVEKTVIKKVEVEKIVEVEKLVEVETVVEKPIIRRRIRIKYRNNPVHMLILGGGCFLIGLILGFLL